MRPRPARSTPSTSGSDMARKGILLLSGGFDSPVAGRLMSRQGLGLVAAHFSLEPITDDAAAVKARTLCGLLEIGSLYVVRVGEAFAEVAHAANRRFYFILTKRLMMRLADAIGDREEAEVLVTGENLGQVSSQTLASLRAIDAIARRPGLRPLLRFDKQELVDRATEGGSGPSVDRSGVRGHWNFHAAGHGLSPRTAVATVRRGRGRIQPRKAMRTTSTTNNKTTRNSRMRSRRASSSACATS